MDNKKNNNDGNKRANTFNKNSGNRKVSVVRVMDEVEVEMDRRRKESLEQLKLNARYIKQSEGEDAADAYMDKLTKELDKRLEKTRQRLREEQKRDSKGSKNTGPST